MVAGWYLVDADVDSVVESGVIPDVDSAVLLCEGEADMSVV